MADTRTLCDENHLEKIEKELTALRQHLYQSYENLSPYNNYCIPPVKHLSPEEERFCQLVDKAIELKSNIDSTTDKELWIAEFIFGKNFFEEGNNPFTANSSISYLISKQYYCHIDNFINEKGFDKFHLYSIYLFYKKIHWCQDDLQTITKTLDSKSYKRPDILIARQGSIAHFNPEDTAYKCILIAPHITSCEVIIAKDIDSDQTWLFHFDTRGISTYPASIIESIKEKYIDLQVLNRCSAHNEVIRSINKYAHIESLNFVEGLVSKWECGGMHITFNPHDNEAIVFYKNDFPPSIFPDLFTVEDALYQAAFETISAPMPEPSLQLPDNLTFFAFKNPTDLYQLAIEKIKEKDYEEAIRHLLDLFEKNSNLTSMQKGDCYSTLASCYSELGQKEKAIESYEKAISSFNLAETTTEKRAALIEPILTTVETLKSNLSSRIIVTR